jgi:hypothetical protein
LLAVGWFVAALFAGIGSDRISIPAAKEVALTITACLIATFFFLPRAGLRVGCGVAFVIGGAWLLLVMWFWN